MPHESPIQVSYKHSQRSLWGGPFVVYAGTCVAPDHLWWVGPAEVESVRVAHAEVSEAAAIGVPDSIKGEALICFCVLKKDTNGDAALAAELKERVARDLGKALAPKEIVYVSDVPKTRNTKVMRRIVRAAYLGEKLGDTSALENLASLEQIK